ncbi:hypothetical protein AQUSIP_23890 [Aquicella siphonis]|uniref:DUF4124 domain-containing protein n=1 Tax=Aquicella siphonis TaxID=254247 RepID=A0A5E4PLC1_9COXI|nr:DUF4124 domain-containing protein [Aquicella siphonis]VVC77062.1 hypothetical protein AQUSIP_23890 [Aquicella siphonis]
MMRDSVFFAATFFLILTALNAHGEEVYEHINQDGSITYSDKPIGENAVTITAPVVSTAPAMASPAPQQKSAATLSADTEARKPYTAFAISSPGDQETIQNQPILIVDVKLDPPLQAGDRIQIYLDGNPLGKAAADTHFEFTIPYRGEHTLSAAIFDKNMKLLKQAPTFTIYVHQAHLGG